MKDRWKILIGLAAFLALACAFSLVKIRVQPESQVEAYKKLLRDRGEKLEISEVVPPPTPAASNSVEAVMDAFRMFGSGSENIPDAMKMVAPGKALVGYLQPVARGWDFTNSWEDAAAEVAANRPAIELLQQVLERPRLDFQLDYKKGAGMLLPNLAPMKRAAQKLDAAAICDLHTGDTAAATTNILTMLGLVEKNERDGVFISYLVRIAMTAIAVVPSWELLQATNVTDAQLDAVQKGWEQLDFLSDADHAVLMERAWATDIIRKLRASHEEFGKELAGSMSSSGSSASGWTWPPDWQAITERPRYAVGEAMWRSSWSYSDELRILKGNQVILETLRTMRTNQSQFYKADYDVMKARMSALGITNAGAAFFRALKIPDLSDVFGDWNMGNVVQKTMRIETACRVVVTAIALKRFQLKNDTVPETLDELVPDFISSIPVDPYDGKPLRYHANKDGSYLLYSVGEDGVDDGGDPTLLAGTTSTVLHWQNPKTRDWVWPQPATAAEIQKYYEAQAKKP